MHTSWPTAMSSLLVGSPSLAAAPKTTPAAGEAALFLKRLLPRFLIMLWPPADRLPSLSTTGRSVAGDFTGLIDTAGCATSVACADATIDLQGERNQRHLKSNREQTGSCHALTHIQPCTKPVRGAALPLSRMLHTSEAGRPLTAMQA